MLSPLFIFYVLYLYVITRFFVGSVFRPSYYPYNLKWILMVVFLPLVGYLLYVKKCRELDDLYAE